MGRGPRPPAGGRAARAPAPAGVAVVALGGYARRELCPSSDVDLLVLHARADRDDLADVVRRLCYPLWDAGLQVGYAVHTPESAVRAAADRIETATALVDRRLVAGERGLLDDLAARVAAWQRRSAPRLLADLATAQAARRARAGRRPGMLEPHLKDGAGGLRDLQGLRWAAAWLVGEANLDALVTAHYLGAGTRRDLGEAGRTLLAARCALHLVRGRRAGTEVDRLRLDLQDEVAARLGMADGDELLRAVGLATRTVARAADRTWPLLLEDARAGRRLRRPPPAAPAPRHRAGGDGPRLRVPSWGRPRRPGGEPDEGRRRNRGLRRAPPPTARDPGRPQTAPRVRPTTRSTQRGPQRELRVGATMLSTHRAWRWSAARWSSIPAPRWRATRRWGCARSPPPRASALSWSATAPSGSPARSPSPGPCPGTARRGRP